MQDTLITNTFSTGFEQFYYYMNPLFMVVLLFTMWIFNDSVEATNFANRMSKLAKIPSLLRALIPSVIWGIIFYWAFRFDKREDVFSLLISTLGTLVVYKLGADRVLKWVSKKLFGLEFVKPVDPKAY